MGLTSFFSWLDWAAGWENHLLVAVIENFPCRKKRLNHFLPSWTLNSTKQWTMTTVVPQRCNSYLGQYVLGLTVKFFHSGCNTTCTGYLLLGHGCALRKANWGRSSTTMVLLSSFQSLCRWCDWSSWFSRSNINGVIFPAASFTEMYWKRARHSHKSKNSINLQRLRQHLQRMYERFKKIIIFVNRPLHSAINIIQSKF